MDCFTSRSRHFQNGEEWRASTKQCIVLPIGRVISTMQKVSGREAPSEAPLYIRWGADRSPYAIELKLELVGRIRQELAAAESAGVEIGGVLVGSLPNSYSSTLRIDDIEIIPCSPQDGATFMLD